MRLSLYKKLFFKTFMVFIASQSTHLLAHQFESSARLGFTRIASDQQNWMGSSTGFRLTSAITPTWRVGIDTDLADTRTARNAQNSRITFGLISLSQMPFFDTLSLGVGVHQFSQSIIDSGESFGSTGQIFTAYWQKSLLDYDYVKLSVGGSMSWSLKQSEAEPLSRLTSSLQNQQSWNARYSQTSSTYLSCSFPL